MIDLFISSIFYINVLEGRRLTWLGVNGAGAWWQIGSVLAAAV